jgi:hypothetical protein
MLPESTTRDGPPTEEPVAMTSRSILVAAVVVTLVLTMAGAFVSTPGVFAESGSAPSEPAAELTVGTATNFTDAAAHPGAPDVYPPPGCYLAGRDPGDIIPFDFRLSGIALLDNGSIDGFVEIQQGQRLQFETFYADPTEMPQSTSTVLVWHHLNYVERLAPPSVLFDWTDEGGIWYLHVFQRYIKWTEHWWCAGQIRGIRTIYVLSPDTAPKSLSYGSTVWEESNPGDSWEWVYSHDPSFYKVINFGYNQAFRNDTKWLSRQAYTEPYPPVHMVMPPDGKIVETYNFKRYSHYLLYVPSDEYIDGYFEVTYDVR